MKRIIVVSRVDGRGRLGSRNGRARLTEDDVRLIRRLHERIPLTTFDRLCQAGREFNVHPTTIQKIVQGKTWTHV